MAAYTGTTFEIFPEYFYAGYNEVMMQNADIFNAGSAGAIRFIPNKRLGDYAYETFNLEIADLITRRDITSTGDATDLDLTQEQKVSVKLNRTIGPVLKTLDAWRKLGRDEQHGSMVIGQQVARAVQVNYVNAAVKALSASLANQASQLYDATNGIIQIIDLIAGQALMGDAYSMVRAWLIHSKPFHDLMKDNTSFAVENVAGATIVSGTVAGLGKPFVVTDDASLVVSGTPDNYYTLGLVGDAAIIEDSEPPVVETDLVTGKKNLAYRMQGEYAFNLGLKGMAWDVANGGANPTDATLATGSNWDQKASDDKGLPGVIIQSQ